MILPDANLLLYAYDASSQFHARSAEWWSDCLSGAESVALVSPVLLAFVRLGTSRRVFEQPMTPAEAARHVRSWLERPMVEHVPVIESDLLAALDDLIRLGAGGGLTTDAVIAAVARRLQATIHSADADFERFENIVWENPLR
jgi:hypothetical protein